MAKKKYKIFYLYIFDYREIVLPAYYDLKLGFIGVYFVFKYGGCLFRKSNITKNIFKINLFLNYKFSFIDI